LLKKVCITQCGDSKLEREKFKLILNKDIFYFYNILQLNQISYDIPNF